LARTWSPTGLAWFEKFAGLAALLTRPEEVQSVLTGQPWREIQPE
jgi:hypothetical protein